MLTDIVIGEGLQRPYGFKRFSPGELALIYQEYAVACNDTVMDCQENPTQPSTSYRATITKLARKIKPRVQRAYDKEPEKFRAWKKFAPSLIPELVHERAKSVASLDFFSQERHYFGPIRRGLSKDFRLECDRSKAPHERITLDIIAADGKKLAATICFEKEDLKIFVEELQKYWDVMEALSQPGLDKEQIELLEIARFECHRRNLATIVNSAFQEVGFQLGVDCQRNIANILAMTYPHKDNTFPHITLESMAGRHTPV